MAFAVSVCGLVPAYGSGRADGVAEVTGFGTNPGNLRMFRYVPPGVGPGRPLVVALHGCTQSAAAFDDEPGWVELARRLQFVLVLPQQQSANNFSSCFNWFQTADSTRGAGEPLSIKQMVDRARTDAGSDPAKVFVTGLSAGGAMAAIMAATYPDVFAGAAVVAGLPYRCATTLVQATAPTATTAAARSSRPGRSPACVTANPSTPAPGRTTAGNPRRTSWTVDLRPRSTTFAPSGAATDAAIRVMWFPSTSTLRASDIPSYTRAFSKSTVWDDKFTLLRLSVPCTGAAGLASIFAPRSALPRACCDGSVASRCTQP